jgi:Domain of unknown function (DUF4302)
MLTVPKMMKKLTIYILALVTLLPGCNKKTDDLFPETVDERLQKAINSYQAELTEPAGWKLFVYPEGLASQGIEVGGLTYYLQFPDSNRVNMVSDFTIDMASTPDESGYSLKAMQRISLVFDTYSYIHVAADPDETVSFSPTGAGGYGWGTDFDFAFTDAAPGDTIKLEGNFNNSDAFLIRATQEEMDQAFSGRLAEIMQATNDFSSSNAFLYFPGTDNSTIGVAFNLFLYRINFTYISNGQLLTITAPFSHTTYGVHFKSPVTVGGYTFQDAFWDDALELYYIETSNGRVNLTNSDTPLFPLATVLGRSITTISIPTTPLPGQSPLFATVYTQIKDNLFNSPYTLELADMDFIFDDESKTMGLIVYVVQSGITYVLQYVYSYTLSDAGIATFVRIGMNGNASLVENEMMPFLDYIDNDTFEMDYYTGSTPLLGQFISQDNPSFFFTGNLQ